MLRNISATELIVILIFFLFLFGSKKMVELARGLGEAKKELSKAREEFEKTVEEKK